MCVGDETKHCKVWKGRNVCVRKQREEERVRGECRRKGCVWEKAEGQGMCVLGTKGCVCWDAKGGRARERCR